MNEIVDTKSCVLCKACFNICPTKSIKFTKEKNLFYYPQIDKDECIGCNMCKDICIILNPIKKMQFVKKVYAAKNKNDFQRSNSSSGGIFVLIAEQIISNGGTVAGVIMEDDLHAKYVVTDGMKDVSGIMGSKYVQSDMGLCYKEIEKTIKKDRTVLFVGCPCQVAAMKRYINSDKLITVDLICHGMPSEDVFKEYIRFMEKKYNSQVKNIQFRNKEKGWHLSSVKIIFDNGKVYSKPIIDDYYMKGFLDGLYLKEACYDCNFKNFNSGSDITLGDFWGAEVEQKEIDDNKGLSVVVVNSNKGEVLFKSINEKIIIKESSIDVCVKYNRNLFYPTRKNENKERFYYDFKNNPSKAFKKYCYNSTLVKIKRFISNIIRGSSKI